MKKKQKNKNFNLNQTSFYFEDYLNQSENKKYKNLKFHRIEFIYFFFFFSLIVIFAIKITFISLKEPITISEKLDIRTFYLLEEILLIKMEY